MKKTFQVRVRSLARTLKEYKNYKVEVEDYDLAEIANDKKKLEFYQESKSALDQVEKKLLEFYQTLTNYLTEHQAAIQQEPTVQEDYQQAMTAINEVKQLLPASS